MTEFDETIPGSIVVGAAEAAARRMHAFPIPFFPDGHTTSESYVYKATLPDGSTLTVATGTEVWEFSEVEIVSSEAAGERLCLSLAMAGDFLKIGLAGETFARAPAIHADRMPSMRAFAIDAASRCIEAAGEAFEMPAADTIPSSPAP